MMKTIDSPLGPLRLVAQDDRLAAIYLPRQVAPVTVERVADVPTTGVLELAATQLGEYFAGIRRGFELPLASTGTVFQQLVWAGLGRIAYGVTWSYGHLAAHLGRPGASRAVGSANSRNPLSIVVPCHRVIGADGSLTGYAGGVAAKRWLLAHEAQHAVAVRAPIAAPALAARDLPR